MELDVVRAFLEPDAGGGLAGRAGVRTREALIEGGLAPRELEELRSKLGPRPVPDFELDINSAKSPEYFAARFADAVPRADREPAES
jgi:hypothetical protein